MLKKEMQMVALLFPVFCLPFLQDDVRPNVKQPVAPFGGRAVCVGGGGGGIH